MKIPNENQIENLLRGAMTEASPSFEASLERIPGQSRISLATWFKPFAVAAALILGLGLFVLQESRTNFSMDQPFAGIHELDEQWIDLLTLAESVAPAGELTDPELRFALEYYAFKP
jgi:hypothetical protein